MGMDPPEDEPEPDMEPDPFQETQAAPTSTAAPGQETTKQIALEFGGKKFLYDLSLPVRSLSSLADSIKDRLKISSLTTLEFYHEVLEDFVVLDDLRFFPAVPPSLLRVNHEGSTPTFWTWPSGDRATWSPLPGGSTSGASYSLIQDKGVVKDPSSFARLASLFKVLGNDTSSIRQAYAVHNPALLGQFEAHRAGLKARWGSQGVSKVDWKAKLDAGQRALMLNSFHEYLQKFEWNDIRVPIAPAFFSVTEEGSAFGLCQNGFESARDPTGPFGKGMYFTTSLPQALKSAKETSQGKVIILACVISGSCFPVTEAPQHVTSLAGKPCMAGYQSHYSLVLQSTLVPVTTPLSSNNTRLQGDILVAFADAQILPLLILHF